MKSYTMYVCEECGKESKNVKEIMECEANHLGLTKEEFETYKAIKSFVEYAGSILSRTNNEETRKKFDDSIEELLNFELKHGIKS